MKHFIYSITSGYECYQFKQLSDFRLFVDFLRACICDLVDGHCLRVAGCVCQVSIIAQKKKKTVLGLRQGVEFVLVFFLSVPHHLHVAFHLIRVLLNL